MITGQWEIYRQKIDTRLLFHTIDNNLSKEDEITENRCSYKIEVYL